MGLDYKTYLGPYFECQVSKTMRTETYRVCSGEECGGYFDRPIEEHYHYCPTCGHPIVNRTRTIEIDAVHHDDVSRRLKEELWIPQGDALRQMMENQGVHLWFNNRRDSDCSWSLDPTEETIWEEVDEHDIRTQLAVFQEAFSKEFEILKEMYGQENVEVKYGLFNWTY